MRTHRPQPTFELVFLGPPHTTILFILPRLLSAMKKSETFTHPLYSVESTAGMQYQTSSRGSQGPLQATYPAYMVPITTNWLPTLNSAGINISPDPYNGINTGGFFATSAINPSNWTRSSAKAAY
ncbi:uncharacterized protein LACBIDRAFT_316561 [Laccaria bicolor S238N-H82]|uniref:Predicted protein n=1 Tax=Laccaria bicolor (strain S238N-H82 / ATCC MYA-4686) TaxID=486041 RepID=B0E154_LACBS|nr:uncharacterized protein LACBIDRAFT_316561 [Laccaria bicolor S238N-H82]EDQ99396.1 predicted protein [Laccaria bicolor S238N-H82]|eukprot:XP_001889947.1 predicted protein [Laccaria bicolor S238N-H82]